jgi:hypothetical protein
MGGQVSAFRNSAVFVALILVANHGAQGQQGPNAGNALDLAAACVSVLEQTQRALRDKIGQIEKGIRDRCVAPVALPRDDFWHDAIERSVRARIDGVLPQRRSCDQLDVRVGAQAITVGGAISDSSAINRIKAGLQQTFPGIPIDTTQLRLGYCSRPLGDTGFAVNLGSDDRPDVAYRPDGDKAKGLSASTDCQAIGRSIEASLNDIISQIPGSDKSFWVNDVDTGTPAICTFTGGAWQVIETGTKSKRAFIVTRPSK